MIISYEKKDSKNKKRGVMMPIGNPSRQTVASEKYAKSIGVISKSYKLKKSLVDDFAKACNEAGVSQSGKLSEMMQKFVHDVCNPEQ